MDNPSQPELARVYANRFAPLQEYRRRVWQVLVANFFQKLVPESATVLDLGCGYGEFINAVKARTRFGMDLNPSAARHIQSGVRFLQQDCSTRWPCANGELDIVFSSNFFEHLPDKMTLGRTLDEAFRCLKPGGKLIAVGPNIRFTGGRYWDFWDHFLPLTDRSMTEILTLTGFAVERAEPRFLPYSMSQGFTPPVGLISLYIRLPFLWRILGKQFLVIARKS